LRSVGSAAMLGGSFFSVLQNARPSSASQVMAASGASCRQGGRW
jgi:hypothetical protein